MALDPVECHPVLPQKRNESHPQIGILDLRKAFPLPILQPSLVDGIHHIGRVADHMHLRIVPSDCFQTFDDGQKFHPVVGGEAESP